MRFRGGSATVMRPLRGCQPDTGLGDLRPRWARTPRRRNDAAHRAAVHVRHRPAVRPGLGSRLRLANPAAASHQEMAEARGAATSWSPGSSARPEDLCSGFAPDPRRRRPDRGRSAASSTPSAELMELSTVPIGVAARRTATSPRAARPTSRQLHAFLSDTVLLTGEGFDPPSRCPTGACCRARGEVPEPLARARPLRSTRPRLRSLARPPACPGRDPVLPGPRGQRERPRSRTRWPTRSTRPGEAVGVPIFCSSLRGRAGRPATTQLGTLDALVVTVLAAGGTKPATRQRRRRRRGVGRRAARRPRHPVLQGLCLT